MKNKRYKIILLIISFYFIFFVYSNIDLSKKREMAYYGVFNYGKNSSLVYNEKIVRGAEPVFINKSPESVVLLLHGMGGTPIELKEMGEYLAEKNISVVIPLLLYQGRDYASLKKLNSQELYVQVENIYKELNNSYKEVFLAGLCNGGSLALKLGENYDVDGIILMSTPITYGADFVGDFSYYFFKIVRFISPNLRRINYGLAKDRNVKKALPSFDRMPVRVLLEGENLRIETKKNIKKINSSILILHSKFDNRAAPSSAKFIFDNVNSKDKRIVYLDNSGHVITMDYDKKFVFEEAYNFIKKVN